MPERRTQFGKDLEYALGEVLAHRRGEITLPEQVVNSLRPEQIKAIRKAVASSPREFERRFGVPARTVEGWEQGRKLDVAARVLLTVIEQEPEAVERAIAKARGKSRRPIARRSSALRETAPSNVIDLINVLRRS